MKILVISQYYYPEQFRITDICEKMSSMGNEVVVVTGNPNYPEGIIYNGYENGNRREEVINGVKIIRCDNRPRYSGMVNLALNYLSFVIEASKIINRLDSDFDIIYVYEISPVTMAIPAIKMKKKHRIPIYLYCLDIWPEAVREMRSGKAMRSINPIYITALLLSKYVYNKVDKIGIKCTQFEDYLVSTCGVQRKKISLLYEHAESIYLTVSNEPIDNDFYDFFFLGNIGLAQRCDLIIKAAERIRTTKKFQIHFVGDGSELDNLKDYVKSRNLDRLVSFHGKVPLENVTQYYEMADCCLLTLSGNTASGLTLPAKLTGYMAANRPVVAAAKGATKEVIEEAECGICVDPDDIDGLSLAMKAAIENEEKFSMFGDNGRSYFQNHFTLDIHISELMKQMNELIHNNNK